MQHRKALWVRGKRYVTTSYHFPHVFQEDLSRLRRKLEKQKKMEMYTDADEILQEEINQYKVRESSPAEDFMTLKLWSWKKEWQQELSGTVCIRLLSTKV